MDKKISELTPATSIAKTDLLVVVQGSTTNQSSVDTFFSSVPRQMTITEAVETPASGALALNKQTSVVNSAGGTINFTLAAATHGVEKEIVCSTMSGGSPVCIVTVSSGAGFTTLTFTGAGAVGYTAKLKYITNKWYVIGSRGVTIG